MTDYQFIKIPIKVLSDFRLNSTDKIIYGQILSLSSKDSYCRASNKYLALRLNVSVRTIQRSLLKLEVYKYINLVTDNDVVLDSKRKIYIND